jgi:hypothetical protein
MKLLATETGERGLSDGGHRRESEKLERGAHSVAVDRIGPRAEPGNSRKPT